MLEQQPPHDSAPPYLPAAGAVHAQPRAGLAHARLTQMLRPSHAGTALCCNAGACNTHVKSCPERGTPQGTCCRVYAGIGTRAYLAIHHKLPPRRPDSHQPRHSHPSNARPEPVGSCTASSRVAPAQAARPHMSPSHCFTTQPPGRLRKRRNGKKQGYHKSGTHGTQYKCMQPRSLLQGRPGARGRCVHLRSAHQGSGREGRAGHNSLIINAQPQRGPGPQLRRRRGHPDSAAIS